MQKGSEARCDFFVQPPSVYISLSCPGTACLKTSENPFSKHGAQGALPNAMSLLESTDEKTASPLQSNGGESRPDHPRAEADRHISLTLAHELNNLLTVVQGHADRLFAKHQEDAILAPALKKISEAAHRAAELVRSAPKPAFNPPTA